MDHLACFLPAVLMLGHIHGADVTGSAATDGGHFRLAKKLTETCYSMYRMTVTGLGPEIMHFDRSAQLVRGSAVKCSLLSRGQPLSSVRLTTPSIKVEVRRSSFDSTAALMARLTPAERRSSQQQIDAGLPGAIYLNH